MRLVVEFEQQSKAKQKTSEKKAMVPRENSAASEMCE